jgi:hypothetical protein
LVFFDDGQILDFEDFKVGGLANKFDLRLSLLLLLLLFFVNIFLDFDKNHVSFLLFFNHHPFSAYVEWIKLKDIQISSIKYEWTHFLLSFKNWCLYLLFSINFILSMNLKGILVVDQNDDGESIVNDYHAVDD